MAFARLTKISLAAALALAAVLSHAQTNTPPAPARTLYVTVTDKQGKYIKGLTKEDFVVHDGKRRHEPAALAPADAPATVVLLVDASGSMVDSYAKLGRRKGGGVLREALAHFIARSHRENEYAVVAFAREPRLMAEGVSSAAEVIAAIDRIVIPEKKAQTAFYDALHFALETSGRGRHAKRVVVAFTDGEDNHSKRGFKGARRAVAESDVLFYAVRVPTPHDDAVVGFTGRSILEQLSEPSGGMVMFARNGSELLASADLLAAELRSQYALSFAAAPSEKRDGWHELKVRLNEVRDGKGKPVKLNVRAREGFYDAPTVQR